MQKKVAKKRLSFFLQKVTKNPLQMLQKVTKFASKTLQKVTAMIFKRKIFSEIEHWKRNCHKEALLIKGARQVGKTTAVREF
ncbi:MAG: hypothetical protein IIT32_09030, partial [Bacteroidales bacterium]|nr:hypothetical protein [Bacteroidales bacterium]